MTNLSSLYTNINNLVKGYEKQSGSDGSSNTVFTLTNAYVMGNNTLLVFVNGQKAEKVTSASDTTEYEETNSYTITFGSALQDTDIIEFYIVAPYNLSQDNFDTMVDSYQTSVGGLAGFKNKIINGNMDIAQRGTTFVAPANSDYTLDRWMYGKNGDMVHTIYQSADAPTLSECGTLLENNLMVDCTTIDASLAASEHTYVVQRIEGYNIRDLMGKTITISFWVKATKTGIYCISLYNGTDRSYVVEYTVDTTVTWEKKTITLDMHDGSSGTWNYANGMGLMLYFTIATGTTFQTTADTWQSGIYLGTSNQVNGCDSTDNNFKLTGVQFEIGPNTTQFESRSITQETEMCQRYYEKSFPLEVAPANSVQGGIYNGTAISAAAIYGAIYFVTRKRVAPTMQYYCDPSGGAAGQWAYYDASAWHACNITTGRAATTQFTTVLYPSGLTVNSSRITLGNWTADAEL